MAITKDDVKILKSQRMADTEDAGGRATGEAIVDNKLNDVFPSISRLDRTLGHVNLRKLFAGVKTETADAYLGAHAIITQRPQDALVDNLLFNTDSQDDERTAAKAVIEGYLVPSSKARFELLGDQFAGQRMLNVVQHEQFALPEVGDVFQLTDAAGENSQFVRVTQVEHSLVDFVVELRSGDYTNVTRRSILLSISSPLERLYAGGEVDMKNTTDTNFHGTPKARILTTQVADSARYFGVRALAQEAAAGSMELIVDDIYGQLVPSTIRENPITDATAGSPRRFAVPARPDQRNINLKFTVVGPGESQTFLGTSAAPGSVTVNVSGAVYADDATGLLVLKSGSAAFTSAEIDYQTGMIRVSRAGTGFSGTGTASYQHAAYATGMAATGEIEITLGNRGFTYTLNLADAKPRPGTLIVEYMTMGRWYTLIDPGNGILEGMGSGSISFATGSVAVTLDAMPDVDTSIIYSYVAQDDFNWSQHVGKVDAPEIAVLHELADENIHPGSLELEFEHNGTAVTATSSIGGIITGDGISGSVDHARGDVELRFTKLPDPGTGIRFSYLHSESGAPVIDYPIAAGADSGGIATGTIAGAPLAPGSVSMRWMVTRKRAVAALVTTRRVAGTGSNHMGSYDIYAYDGNIEEYDNDVTIEYEAVDNGSGGWNLRTLSGGSQPPGTAITGSINYATGQFSLLVEGEYQYKEYFVKQYSADSRPSMESVNTTRRDLFTGTILCRALPDGSSTESGEDMLSAPQLVWRVLPGAGDPIVPGSLMLRWGSTELIDRDGMLYKDIDTGTNAGTLVGRVDYGARTVTLTGGWQRAAALDDMYRLACCTAGVGFSTNALFIRTQAAPLRPASFQLAAVRADTGDIVTATAALNGEIASDSGVVHGTVDRATGIVRLRFTSDPDDLTGASDVPMIGALIRYNGVAQSFLPIDARLLGLDPVRLPADGRVPIYRDGDVLVIHHTAETEHDPQPGETLHLPRAEQAEIYVLDVNGNRLDESQYTADRESGSITFADPLLLQDAEAEPLTPPYRVMDRLEHMTVCTEAQITGAISINSPLPFTAPAGETLISSALTWGNLQARLYSWFTQRTWNSGNPNWTDNPIGDQTTAQYDQLNNPPIVQNIGAISGRWALVFTSSNSFQVVEEKLGIIASGTTANDTSPINPATGTPYFIIKKEGWGTGWAAGNAVRFNTDACLGPMWCVRTVQPGKGTVDDDHFRLQIRGDAD